MCAHHLKFVGRTVLVRNNDVEAAYRALDRWIDTLRAFLDDCHGGVTNLDLETPHRPHRPHRPRIYIHGRKN